MCIGSRSPTASSTDGAMPGAGPKSFGFGVPAQARTPATTRAELTTRNDDTNTSTIRCDFTTCVPRPDKNDSAAGFTSEAAPRYRHFSGIRPYQTGRLSIQVLLRAL